MADEFILKKESVLELDRVVEKVSNELEESFGLFYIKRSMKKISEPESKTIKNLQEKLDEMKNKIENFQRDLLQACSPGGAHLEVPERRAPFIRGPSADRDSGYTSSSRLSVVSSNSEQSSNRLSKDLKDDDRKFSEEAEQYNPSPTGSSSSISDDDQTNSKRPVFFLNGLGSETSSIGCKEERTGDIKNDEGLLQKTANDDSSTTNQSNIDPDIIKGKREKTSPEATPTSVQETNNHACQSHAGRTLMDEACDNTVPKVIEGEVTIIINNLSKPSSEEDNTKYAS
ncbi:uncharacterized protein LOC132760430 [Ruditapes philippinarum]|uniref:uncharacterized protein LOC132760430 n=1 Tax=Ruditapes philippinarum TaxID=129788 RepID=UPI00295BD89E|nr:uncharacterized protein LOC132760430 [Ruditapes philippinarum]